MHYEKEDLSIKDLIKNPNGIIEKAREFRYLVLLCVFLVFTDISLVLFKGIGISELTVSVIETEISIGQGLLFLGSLSLFLAFFMPILKHCITFSAFSLPAVVLDFFGLLKSESYPKDDYANIYDMERDAISENNEIKYIFTRQVQKSRSEEKQIEFYCLCLLVVTTCGFIVSPDQSSSLTFWICHLMLGDHDPFLFRSIQLFLWALFASCFYIGVYQGCLQSKWGEYKIYLPKYYKNTLNK